MAHPRTRIRGRKVRTQSSTAVDFSSRQESNNESRIRSTPKGEIRIIDVVKSYGVHGTGILAIDHCTFHVRAGDITVVVGPSGCGKTTLLNAIAGFHSLSSGSIYLDDEMLCGPRKLKANPGPDRIVVFQNGALFPWKTNLENVAFGPIMQGRLTRAEAHEKARHMMADAGLNDIEHNYPGEISSGVRASANQPSQSSPAR